MTKTPTYRQLYVMMVSMKLSEEQLAELRAALKPDTYDGSVPARAQIVLWYYEGYPKVVIARMSGASRPTIDKWIGRYEKYGLDGLGGTGCRRAGQNN